MKRIGIGGGVLLAVLFVLTGCQKKDEGGETSSGGGVTSYILTLTKAGTGTGQVTSSPGGLNCGSACSAAWAPGTVVTLSATPAPGMTFGGWTGGGCSGTGSCVVTMDAQKTVTATFTDPAASVRSVTINKTGAGGGTVSSSPSGISCGADCSENYALGTSVTLTAIPDGASQFQGWSGGGCSGTGSCVIAVNADTVVTAQFEPTPPSRFALTVSRAGTGGGSVTSADLGINCGSDCSETYVNGTSITLTPTPDATSTFAGWGGACSGAGSCVVTMTEARSVTATFTKITYALAVTRSGTGAGTVTSSPAGINCGAVCSSSFDINTSVTLSATPGATSDFGGWSGACTGMGTCVIDMNSAQNVQAQFIAKQEVRVTKTGGGLGTVTSSPAGIDCGLNCSAYFSYGQSVTLTAVPDLHNLFNGWSGGGCSGTGSCTVTANELTSVSASFVPDYSGTWSGITQQSRPMSFVVVDNKVTTASYEMGVTGCGVISSTVTYGTPLPIVPNAFDSGGVFSYFKGSFSSVDAAAGSLKADLTSFCGVYVTVNWTASRGAGVGFPSISMSSQSSAVETREWTDSNGNRIRAEKQANK